MKLSKQEISEIRNNDIDNELFMLFPVELTHKSESVKKHAHNVRLGHYMNTGEVVVPIRYITEPLVDRKRKQEEHVKDSFWCDLFSFNKQL